MPEDTSEPNFEEPLNQWPEPQAADGDSGVLRDPLRFPLSELGTVERVERVVEGTLLYVPTQGFLAWTGKRWEHKEPEWILNLIGSILRSHRRALARSENEEFENEIRWLKSCENKRRLTAIATLLKGRDSILAEPADFDGRPGTVNFENGTLELSEERLRCHDPEDRLTLLLDYDFTAAAASPRFEEFLHTITGGNEDLVRFLQRCAGYSLLGHPTEEVLFFLYGTGANGKSTFMEAIKSTLGTYSQKAPASLLQKSNQVPVDRARLKGKRLVISSELDEAMMLAEAEIKDLVSRDTIVARELYKGFFEFQPSHVLWILGNHRPRVSGTDDGIWRRLLLVPFTVTIPEEERDPGLLEEFKRHHRPAIMNWMIEGARSFLEEGLNPPSCVTNASRAYRRDMDVVQRFLDACCVVEPGAQVPVGQLYKSYKSWVEEGGEHALSKVRLGRRLSELGFAQDRTANVRIWTGFRLNPRSPDFPASISFFS